METNKSKLTRDIGDIFRNFSISMNLTVYSIYLLFLIYSISAGIGIQIINIILAVATAIFMLVYLFLRLSSRKNGKKIRKIKHYYKNFKLATKLITTITAVYAVITATDSGSPLAMIVSMLGAVFLVIRIFAELFLYFIKKKVRKVKENIISRFAPKDTESFEEDDAGEFANLRGDRLRRKDEKRKSKNGHSDDIFISVDDCLLSDVEDF